MLYRVSFKRYGASQFSYHSVTVSSNNRENAIKKACKEENYPRNRVVHAKLDEPRQKRRKR